MKNIGNRKPKTGSSPAFTLMELLVVIAIIGILAGMLSVALPAAVKRVKVVKARTEIADIVNAIQAYDSDYSRFPVSTSAQSAATLAGGDFTFGSTYSGVPVQNPSAYAYQATNSEVVAILMDLTSYPIGTPTANNQHVKNPKQIKYLNPKMSGYDPTINVNDANPPGGVDNLGIYRDPWGSPYIISVDLNYDNMCRDAFYCLDKVSGNNQTAMNPGLNALTTDGTPDNFQFHGKVMVWSVGPDQKVDPTIPANFGVNKDNILSWQ